VIRFAFAAGLAVLPVVLCAPIVLVAAAGSGTNPSTATSLPGCAIESPHTVAGVELSGEQFADAAAIASVVRSRRLPEQAAVIALMTAMQESSLVSSLKPFC